MTTTRGDQLATGTRHEPSAATRIAAGVTRLALGWVFLGAFLDKTFGLGFATPADAAWLAPLRPEVPAPQVARDTGTTPGTARPPSPSGV